MPIGGLAGIYNPDNPNNFPPPDDGSGSPPPDTTNPPPTSGGGAPDYSTYTSPDGSFDVSKFLSGVLNAAPGVGNGDISTALLIPAFGAAYKQWQDAAKYKQTALDASKYGDEFGQANRTHYQQMLQDSYDHPDQVLNDPSHMATIKSGLDTVSRADASKGYLGSGNMEGDLAKYVANENAKYLDSYRAGLQPLTGSQFNPSAAGDFLMQGQKNEIESQNAALQDMFMPFLAKAAQNNINNNTKVNPDGTPKTTNPAGDPNPYGRKTPQNTTDDPNLVSAVNAGDKAAINAAIDAGKQWVKMPDGTMVNLYSMAQGGYRTGERDSMFYPTDTRGDGAPGAGGGADGGGSGAPTPDTTLPQPGDDDPNGPIPDPPVDPENYGDALLQHFQ